MDGELPELLPGEARFFGFRPDGSPTGQPSRKYAKMYHGIQGLWNEEAMATLNESTYQRIWELIMSGELERGSRLDERILAERLKVSRTPVREAINRLVQDNVVVREPYRGIFVTELDSTEISDIYVVRKELEGLAIRLALPRMSDMDLKFCEELVSRGDEALASGRLDLYGQYDGELHEFIIEKSANDSLKQVLHSLRRQIQLVRAFGNRKSHIAIGASHSRRALLDAMMRRDLEDAARLLKEHIEEVRLAVLEAVRSELGETSISA